MRRIFLTGIIFILVNSIKAQVQFYDVPKSVEGTITALIKDFKNKPPAYDLDLSRMDSYSRKGFADSVDQLHHKYENIMPKYYADNWKLLNKKIFRDSSNAQYGFLYGVHKNIYLADSMAIFSADAYRKYASEKFKLSSEELNLGKGELSPYIVTYYKGDKDKRTPLLLTFLTEMAN
ncbi:hypothetical protein ACTJIJ_10080 [Niabella sp. 22666]|uniref:hypothetical protein n=1 Tax=Niabella sp. 22666 TaxID=3453954 RepID=UPI003F834DBB